MTDCPYPPLRPAILGTWATFFLAGALSAGWTVRVPSVKQKLGLTDAQLGWEVLGWGLSALLAMQLAGRMNNRFGSRRVLQFTLPGLALSLVPVGLAPSYPMLLMAGVGYGFLFGLLDIGMNTQASRIEGRSGRSIMGRMHAGWSIGTVTGGLLGALAAALGADFTTAMLIFAGCGLPLTIWASRSYLADDSGAADDGRRILPTAEPATGRRAALAPTITLLGVVVFCVFLAEGAVADWSGVLLHGSLGSGEVLAALAYPLFEATMAVGRLTGERWSRRCPLAVFLVCAGAVASIGFAVVAAAPGPWWAMGGFVLVGVGTCLAGPLIISAAGQLDRPNADPAVGAGRPATAAIARVSSIGYAGLLLGPVAIGLLADRSDLRVGFAAVIGCCVCWAGVAWCGLRSVRLRDHADSGSAGPAHLSTNRAAGPGPLRR